MEKDGITGGSAVMEWKRVWKKKNVWSAILLIFILQMFLFGFRLSGTRGQPEEDLQYAENFHENIEAVVEQADSIDEIGIFSKKDSFTNRNLEKTREDFSKLLDVDPIAFDNRFLTEYFDFSVIHILVVIAGCFLVLAISGEEKQGLKSMVFTTMNGRGWLSARKMAALLWWEAVLTFIFYGMTLLLSCLWYHARLTECLGYPVQSLSLFSNLTWKIDIGTFLIVYFIYRWLTLFFITLIAWVVLCYTDQLLIAVGTVGILGLVSFVLYQLIGSNHPINLLHYCNFIYLLKDTTFFTEYKNLNVFSYVVNKNYLIAGTYVVLVALTVGAGIWVGERKYPCASKSRKVDRCVAKISQQVQNFLGALQEKLPLLGVEFYKLLISQKGIFIVILLFCALILQTDMTEVQHSGSQKLYYDFMERFIGVPDEQSQQEIAKLSKTITTIDREYETKTRMYENGDLSADEYIAIVQKDQLFAQDRIFLEQIQKQTEYLQNLRTERNISGWYINMYSYTHLLREGDTLWNLFLMLGILLLGSSAFSSEKKYGMIPIIRGCYAGRNEFFKYKVKAVLTITLLIFLSVSSFEIIAVKSVYGLRGFAAPVQSVEQLSFISVPCSIGMFFAFLYVIKGVFLLALSALVCVISFNFGQKTVIISFLFCCIPTLLTTAGFTFFRYISLSEILSVAPFMIQTQNLLSIALIATIFVIVSVFSLEHTYKNWCTT